MIEQLVEPIINGDVSADEAREIVVGCYLTDDQEKIEHYLYIAFRSAVWGYLNNPAWFFANDLIDWLILLDDLIVTRGNSKFTQKLAALFDLLSLSYIDRSFDQIKGLQKRKNIVVWSLYPIELGY